MLLAGACGGGSGGSSTCGPVEHIVEPGAIHVLPGVEVSYDHSPPTSGPHAFPAPEPGVHRSPIEPALQVAALESGAVIVQYETGTDGGVVERIEALAATDGVLVAPGAATFDEGAAVAFTAWGVRMLCEQFDDSSAERFVREHAGTGSDAH